MNHNADIFKGSGAVAVNFLALLTSAQEHFEFWLRCSSLLIGLLVGILTAISICRKLNQK